MRLEGEAEAAKCAIGCRYYADHGVEFLAPRPHESDGSDAFVRHEPLGPVLAIWSVVVLLTVLTGVASSRDLLRRPPLPVLREAPE